MASPATTATAATIEQSTTRIALPYNQVVQAFESAVGRLDPVEAATALVHQGETWKDFEAAMTRAAGPSGLMILATFDQGAVASFRGVPVLCRLYLVGNPVIAAQIVEIDPRASLYVPFRVALYAEGGGPTTTIAFDRPSSSLRTLGREELQPIAVMLDGKIDAVVESIRRLQKA